MKSDLNENSGEIITLTEAIGYVSAFRELMPDEKRAFYVGKNKVNAILEQENCMGMRIYMGYNDAESSLNLVLVGVDKDENDMTQGIIVERLFTCPPYCPLNSDLM